jgi:hypothetical protein
MIIYSNEWQDGKNATNSTECLGFVIGKNLSKLEIFSEVASGSSIIVFVIDAITSQQVCEIIVYGNNTIKYSSTTNMINLPTDNTLYEINYNLYSRTTGVLYGVKLLD